MRCSGSPFLSATPWTALLVALLCAPSLPAVAQLEPQPRPDDESPPPPPLPQPRLETPPSLLTGVDPVYPDEARAAGRAGDVVLQITIDAQGRVARVGVVAAPGEDEVAWALYQWQGSRPWGGMCDPE